MFWAFVNYVLIANCFSSTLAQMVMPKKVKAPLLPASTSADACPANQRHVANESATIASIEVKVKELVNMHSKCAINKFSRVFR